MIKVFENQRKMIITLKSGSDSLISKLSSMFSIQYLTTDNLYSWMNYTPWPLTWSNNKLFQIVSYSYYLVLIVPNSSRTRIIDSVGACIIESSPLTIPLYILLAHIYFLCRLSGASYVTKYGKLIYEYINVVQFIDSLLYSLMTLVHSLTRCTLLRPHCSAII